MPIYAYRCEACGHAKDVLQKVSDPVLTECPACGAAAFKKQVTASSFQLKGTGWYVTDFRGGAGAPPSASESPTDTPASAPAAPAPAAAAPSPVPAASPAPMPAAPAPAAAKPPAGGQ
jgi:putative FmdB family regulatory protein